MAENKMKEVATLLGVELEEEFRIDGFDSKYKLTKDGLVYLFDNDQEWLNSCWLEELLTGKAKVVKLPKPILDEKEKEYLSNVIKPFRDRIVWIRKCEYARGDFFYGEYIVMGLKFFDSGTDEFICTDVEQIALPSFAKGTMYKGMETDKAYTPDELGL